MKFRLPRTVTEVGNEPAVSRPLADFRNEAALVLIGDPGAGKTTEFLREAEALGSDAAYLPAYDFGRFSDESRRETRTLFVDGLDEMRAGHGDPRPPLDAIVAGIARLGFPPFRVSCRAVDWFGRIDRARLETVSSTALTVVRLDALSDEDIERLLGEHLAPEKAGGFRRKAREIGLFEMLRSPQGLEVLVRAFASGEDEWPTSRRDAFERACRQLAEERNDEHSVATESPPTADRLLEAAGEWSARLLLGGAAGCARRRQDADANWVAPPPEAEPAIRAVLGTPLFAAAPEDGRFVPAHRQVAEFLAGRYLARRVEDDRNDAGRLPVGRVLSWVAAAAGGAVPTPLRGLAAWFAAHCPEARAVLLRADPVAMAAYGDTAGYSTAEKRLLLQRLQDEPPEFGPHRFPAEALRPLAVPPMAASLREVLESTDRGDAAQVAAGIALRALAVGEPMPDTSELLLGIAREPDRWRDIRLYALDAYIHNAADEPSRDPLLRRLLADLRDGSVPDEERELLGTLLDRLFPEAIPPAGIWDYLLPQPGRLVGRYDSFWLFGLTDARRRKFLPEVLEALRPRLPELWPALTDRILEGLPARLVARCLEEYGEETPVPRLYDWLRLAMSHRWRYSCGGSDAEQRIANWLETHREASGDLWREALARCPETDEFRERLREASETLGIVAPPDDFGRRCLDWVREIGADRPRLAKWLLFQAVERSGTEGIPFEEVRSKIEGRRELEECLPGLLRTPLRPGYLVEDRGQRDFVEERRRDDAAVEVEVRAESAALRGNRGRPGLLHLLAGQYLSSLDPAFRLLGDGWRLSDPALRRVAADALALTPSRKDVPDAGEILRLHSEDRFHYLTLPFLAGLEAIERNDAAGSVALDERQRECALAFYFTAPSYRGDLPDWFRRLVREEPEPAARLLVRFVKAEIAAGSAVIPNLDSLLLDPAHAEVAARAAPELLSGFPVRAQGKQVEVLDLLLWSAIRYADRGALLPIIARKAAAKSMTVPQRPHWVAAGLVTAPEIYREEIEPLFDDAEAVFSAAQFFCPDYATNFPDEDTAPDTLRFLATRLGAMFGPEMPPDPRVRGLEDRAGDWIRGVLDELASRVGPAPGQALDALLEEPALERWARPIESARRRQRTRDREAGFRHPDAERITRALYGGPPASAADLSALVAEHLDDLACHFAGGDANEWRSFWNEDPFGRPLEPKNEESCRDALLAALRRRLGGDYEVTPEARHAGDARSDLLVRSNGYSVPIEIKREGHRELWTAVSEQLLPRYAASPEAAGRGIYLVLWFGGDDTARPPKGIPPTTPEDLRRRLLESLPRSERDRVEVRVLDVRPPKARRDGETVRATAKRTA